MGREIESRRALGWSLLNRRKGIDVISQENANRNTDLTKLGKYFQK
jgi:hypothetical protein